MLGQFEGFVDDGIWIAAGGEQCEDRKGRIARDRSIEGRGADDGYVVGTGIDDEEQISLIGKRHG